MPDVSEKKTQPISDLVDLYLIKIKLFKWYWTKKKQDVEAFLLPKSMWNALYHVGTIAFGSLLLAIIRFVSDSIFYISSPPKHLFLFSANTSNPLLRQYSIHLLR